MLDRLRLHQVLINLLSNAIKFSDRCSSVLVECKLEQAQLDKKYTGVSIEVIDCGVGISEND